MAKNKLDISNNITVTDAPHIAVTDKEASKELLEKVIKEDTKMVKGKFRCYETPGANQRIQIRKYPGIPMFDKVMEDGKEYEVPLYVARFLNGTDAVAKGCNYVVNSCAFPTHGFKYENGMPKQFAEDGGGVPVPIIQPVKWTKRYGFESLEFGVVT